MTNQKLPAPANFKAEPRNGKVILTWDKVPGAEGYKIIVFDTKTDNTFEHDVGPNTTRHIMPDLDNGTRYEFDMFATDKNGQLAGDVAKTQAIPALPPIPSNANLVPPPVTGQSLPPVGANTAAGTIQQPPLAPPLAATRTQQVVQTGKRGIPLAALLISLLALALAIWLGWCKGDKSGEVADKLDNLDTRLQQEVARNNQQGDWLKGQTTSLQNLVTRIDGDETKFNQFVAAQKAIDDGQNARLDRLENWKNDVITAAQKYRAAQKAIDDGQNAKLDDQVAQDGLHDAALDELRAKLQQMEAEMNAQPQMPEVVVYPPSYTTP